MTLSPIILGASTLSENCAKYLKQAPTIPGIEIKKSFFRLRQTLGLSKYIIHISQREVMAIKSVGDQILKDYPPHEYVYVGLGRSPTAIMAYFQSLDHVSAFNLPLSGLRNHPKYKRLKPGKTPPQVFFQKPLKEEEQSTLFKHFDHFAPHKKVLGQRKILVIDYVQSGVSLLAATAYLRKSYQTKNIRNEIIPLALVDPVFNQQGFNIMQLQGVSKVIINEEDLRLALAHEKYDDISEFGHFSIQNISTAAPNSNPTYKLLVEEFRKMPKAIKPLTRQPSP